MSVEVRHPEPGGADLFVRPLQGRANRWAEQPWAAGTKTVPLPAATQFKPLRGSETPLSIWLPPVSSKRYGSRSAPREREIIEECGGAPRRPQPSPRGEGGRGTRSGEGSVARPGPFEGPAIVKPPALPGDIYNFLLLQRGPSHVGIMRRSVLNSRPSPEGGSQPALSSAGARRGPPALLVVGVRGLFPTLAMPQETYSRSCQTFTASPAEPGGLPTGLAAGW